MIKRYKSSFSNVSIDPTQLTFVVGNLTDSGNLTASGPIPTFTTYEGGVSNIEITNVAFQSGPDGGYSFDYFFEAEESSTYAVKSTQGMPQQLIQGAFSAQEVFSLMYQTYDDQSAGMGLQAEPSNAVINFNPSIKNWSVWGNTTPENDGSGVVGAANFVEIGNIGTLSSIDNGDGTWQIIYKFAYDYPSNYSNFQVRSSGGGDPELGNVIEDVTLPVTSALEDYIAYADVSYEGDGFPELTWILTITEGFMSFDSPITGTLNAILNSPGDWSLQFNYSAFSSLQIADNVLTAYTGYGTENQVAIVSNVVPILFVETTTTTTTTEAPTTTTTTTEEPTTTTTTTSAPEVGPIENFTSQKLTAQNGTFTSVSGTSNGSGTGALFDISLIEPMEFGAPAITVTMVNSGSGYAVGEVISIPNSVFGDPHEGVAVTITVTSIIVATTTTTTTSGSTPTFTTSKAQGESIFISVASSTGWWKVEHDNNISLFNGSATWTVGSNGDFTIWSVDGETGEPSGDIINLNLDGQNITNFNGSLLTNLGTLSLNNNGLTSITNFVFPSSLVSLILANNQLASFDGSGFTSLEILNLNDNQLTSFDGTSLTNLTNLYLSNNGITSLVDFIFPTNLTTLSLNNNGLTSFDGTGLSNLIELGLYGNQLASFVGTGLLNLTSLYLDRNPLTSFDGSAMTSLNHLNLGQCGITSLENFTFPSSLTSLDFFSGKGGNNYISSFDPSGLPNLIYLELRGNPMTPEANDFILDKLEASGLSNGGFFTSNGRTSAGDSDFVSLKLRNWRLDGAGDEPVQTTTTTTTEDQTTTTTTTSGLTPTFVTSRKDGLEIGVVVITNTGYFKYYHNGSYSSPMISGTLAIMVENANGEFTLFACDGDGNITGDITEIGLEQMNITSFNGTELSSLTSLNLAGNDQLTSFNGTGLFSLQVLNLYDCQISSFDGTDMNNLQQLNLQGNSISSVDSFIWPSNLNILHLGNSKRGSNNLTFFNPVNLPQLNYLTLEGNPFTYEANDQILRALADGNINGGFFAAGGSGRTFRSDDSYNTLVNRGWVIQNLGGVETTTTTTTVAPPITDYALTFRKISYGGNSPKNAPLTISEFEGNFAYLSDYINHLLNVIDTLNGTISELESQNQSLANRVSAIENGGAEPAGPPPVLK